MKPAAVAIVLLVLGIGTGYYLGSTGALPGPRGDRLEIRELSELREKRIEDDELIKRLQERIAELERQLAAQPVETSPYADDTPELLEKLLEEAYGETNIDLFLDVIDRLLKEDQGLRVVYRELPILGPDSVVAARLALQASKMGRFGRFHDTLWAAGRPAPDTVEKAAQAAGIPPAPVQDPAIEAELKKNFQLAGQLGATGTPVFIVGDRVMNGAVGYDALKQAIATAREKKS